MNEDKKSRKILTVEQIKSIAENRGFTFKKFTFETSGKYTVKDSMFNHRDIAHYNTLHAKMAKNMKHEVIYQGTSTTTFMRYYEFMFVSVPMIAQLIDTKENQIIEVFLSMFFQFIKVKTEHKIDEDNAKSVLDFFVGSKSKIAIMIASPFIKRVVKVSFDDYLNEDVPYMELRGKLRKQGYQLTKDVEKFTHFDTSKLLTKNINLTKKIKLPDEISINLQEFEENKILKLGEVSAFGFQILKEKNFLKVYPRLCPHEAGCLDIDNEYGGGFKVKDVIDNQQIKCTVHNRRFRTIVDIDLMKPNKTYETNFYKFTLTNQNLLINYKEINDVNINQDWTT
jgi:hypothetical protein